MKKLIFAAVASCAISLSAMASCDTDQAQMETQIAQYGSIATQSHTVDPAPNITNIIAAPTLNGSVCTSLGSVGNSMQFILTWNNGDWGNTLFADFYTTK